MISDRRRTRVTRVRVSARPGAMWFAAHAACALAVWCAPARRPRTARVWRFRNRLHAAARGFGAARDISWKDARDRNRIVDEFVRAVHAPGVRLARAPRGRGTHHSHPRRIERDHRRAREADPLGDSGRCPARAWSAASRSRACSDGTSRSPPPPWSPGTLRRRRRRGDPSEPSSPSRVPARRPRRRGSSRRAPALRWIAGAGGENGRDDERWRSSRYPPRDGRRA